MNRTLRMVTGCLLLLALLSACGSAPASSSQRASEPSAAAEGMERRYMKQISYEIPEDWDSETAFQGYYHTAPDGGIFYATHTPENHLGLSAAMAENSDPLIKARAYMEGSQGDFTLLKDKESSFLGCRSLETWYELELETGHTATMFCIQFEHEAEVYTLLFTASSSNVEAAMPDIIRSVKAEHSQSSQASSSQ